MCITHCKWNILSHKESNSNDKVLNIKFPSQLRIFICVEMVNSRLKFASPQSDYQIIVGSQDNTNYTYWTSKCEGKLILLLKTLKTQEIILNIRF